MKAMPIAIPSDARDSATTRLTLLFVCAVEQTTGHPT
jgi:hypothetical protein